MQFRFELIYLFPIACDVSTILGRNEEKVEVTDSFNVSLANQALWWVFYNQQSPSAIFSFLASQLPRDWLTWTHFNRGTTITSFLPTLSSLLLSSKILICVLSARSHIEGDEKTSVHGETIKFPSRRACAYLRLIEQWHESRLIVGQMSSRCMAFSLCHYPSREHAQFIRISSSCLRETGGHSRKQEMRFKCGNNR